MTHTTTTTTPICNSTVSADHSDIFTTPYSPLAQQLTFSPIALTNTTATNTQSHKRYTLIKSLDKSNETKINSAAESLWAAPCPFIPSYCNTAATPHLSSPISPTDQTSPTINRSPVTTSAPTILGHHYHYYHHSPHHHYHNQLEHSNIPYMFQSIIVTTWSLSAANRHTTTQIYV